MQMFQFLYGAIGISTTNKTILRNAVSIPIWCNWDYSSGKPTMTDQEVSIPIWCNWDIVFVKRNPNLLKVSIPIWCNWDIAMIATVLMNVKFQFLYGAIGIKEEAAALSSIRKFQFLYGAIGIPDISMELMNILCFYSYMVQLGFIREGRINI